MTVCFGSSLPFPDAAVKADMRIKTRLAVEMQFGRIVRRPRTADIVLMVGGRIARRSRYPYRVVSGGKIAPQPLNPFYIFADGDAVATVILFGHFQGWTGFTDGIK